MVRLNRVVPDRKARIYAKLEWYNPFGSVKDRVAENLIRDAGLLPQVQEIAETLLEQYPDAATEIMRRWIGDAEQYGSV